MTAAGSGNGRLFLRDERQKIRKGVRHEEKINRRSTGRSGTGSMPAGSDVCGRGKNLCIGDYRIQRGDGRRRTESSR